MSDRNNFSSTQYGPSVTVGVAATLVIVVAASTVSFQAGIKYATAPAPAMRAIVLRQVNRLFAYAHNPSDAPGLSDELSKLC